MEFNRFRVSEWAEVTPDEFSIHDPLRGLLEGVPNVDMILQSVHRHIERSLGERQTLLLNQPDRNAFYVATMHLTSDFVTAPEDDGTELVAVLFVRGFDSDVPSQMIEEIKKHDWSKVSRGFQF